MKKIALLLVSLIFCFAAHAKHLEFMGIPITGTITSFQSKLIAKGCTVSKYNKEFPTGVRAFRGVFAGKDCNIIVWFNHRTKIVYSVRAVADSDTSVENSHNMFYYFKNLLNQKYEGMAITSDMLEDSDNSEYEFSLVVIEPPVEEGSKAMGTIDVHIIDYDGYPKSYGVAITYSDFENSSKNEQETLDDL